MMDRLAEETLGGATAPLTVALTYWTRSEYEASEDGTSCRGIAFIDTTTLKEGDAGERNRDTLNVRVCTNSGENGIDTKPERNGAIRCRDDVYRIVDTKPGFGFWDIFGRRVDRTQVSHEIFQDLD